MAGELGLTVLAVVGGFTLFFTALGQVVGGESGETFRKLGVDLKGIIDQIDRNL